ncbi:MAG: hypothetical protein JSV57_01825 [Candidatus Bathyarchaeota archaeon]|nr:MAG: hypothetical protein JSV57_01825 [Candidatus Bathyarchaeota archaeon]
MKRLLGTKDNTESPQELDLSDTDSAPDSLQTEDVNAPQTSEEPEKPVEPLCPKCGKVASDPVKLTDLSGGSKEIYDACPYCMSRLGPTAGEQKTSSKKVPIKKPEPPKKVDAKKKGGSRKCPHHLGYLRERPRDVPIPNGCLACPEAVECLLG